jgi:hypothetical protein
VAEREQNTVESWRKEARDHYVGCACRAEQHKVEAATWRRWRWLPVASGFFASLAAAGLFKGIAPGETLWWIALGLAIAAALTGAINASWKPAESQRTHERAHDIFVRMMFDFGDFNDLAPLIPFEQAAERWQRLRREHAEAKESLPEPSQAAKDTVSSRRPECRPS